MIAVRNASPIDHSHQPICVNVAIRRRRIAQPIAIIAPAIEMIRQLQIPRIEPGEFFGRAGRILTEWLVGGPPLIEVYFCRLWLPNQGDKHGGCCNIRCAKF